MAIIFLQTERITCKHQAQIDLIDQVLKWADVESATKVIDVGYGIGGS
jgi:tocopherol O-methyltransferase